MLAVVPTLPAQSPGARNPDDVLDASPATDWVAIDPESILVFDVPAGRILVALAPEFAPAHVTQMKTLARSGYFEGARFYRVIEGFVAQGGDFSGTKPFASGRDSLVAEFDMPWRADIPFVALSGRDGNGPEAADSANWTPVLSVRVAADLPAEELPDLEWLDPTRATFAAWIEANRNPSQPWIVRRPRHFDVCERAVPVRERSR